MQQVDISVNQDSDLAVRDLGPLSWVLEELRKSFDVSVKILKRFLAESSGEQSDLSVIDAGQLRSAKQHFHHVFGALKLLAIDEASVISEAMESVAGKFLQKPSLVSNESVNELEHASFAVLEYLESLLAGKNVSSLGLFVHYRNVNRLAGMERVHPADLWVRQGFKWLKPQISTDLVLDYSLSVREDLDSALLRLIKSADENAAYELSQLSLGLSQSQSNDKAHIFWIICAAFFEAVAQKLIPIDIYAKRTASGVVTHYNNLKHGDWVFSDKFMQNMLFLCAQARINNADNTRCLAAVQKTWNITDSIQVNYEVSQFGRFDPVMLATSKKRIIVAKELWTALTGGDIHKIRSTAEQFKLVSESLLKLHPSSQTLAQALVNASESIVMSKEAPSAELAMEVATAILYLEAVFEGWSSTDEEMELRAKKLALRIESVSNGGQAENVEPWIEDLYRRVSDRESMGSVVGELRICLTEIEKSIDQYFRSPKAPQVLRTVPEKLTQMKSIFSVLGLDEASSAVNNMRDRVEEFELSSFNFEQARDAAVFDKFANNLGALGFLIDMLNYQPALAKKLFVYDSRLGNLSPLMGRVKQTVDSHSSSEIEAAVEASSQEELIEKVTSKEHHVAPNLDLRESVDSKTTEDILAESKITDVDELTDVFLAEALEVIQSGLESAHSLLEMPGNLEQQSTLRRVFHTLKGSSRMVGIDDFGEAGWAFEQVINTRLTDQTPFDKDICVLSIAALNSFKSWINEIASGKSISWNAETFKSCAEAMRIEARLDTRGLIDSDFFEDNLQIPALIDTEDEVFLQSLENFELLELSKVNEDNVEANDLDDVSAILKTENAETSKNAEAILESDQSTNDDAIIESEVISSLNVESFEALSIKAATDVVVNFPIPATNQIENVEQFKVIGSLKIGIPLYNVYLNEADEWSRCLVTELDEWVIERHKPLNISTVNFAHSLAGSSATVGFLQLSNLAKKLEHALEKVLEKEIGTETEATVFTQTAEECRRLLHQFAAGFLEEPKTSVLAKLESLHFSESKPTEKENSTTINAELNAGGAELAVEPSTGIATEAKIDKLTVVNDTVVTSSTASEVDYSKQTVAHRVDRNVVNEDDIDLVDSIDPDLFHIFEEEARDLLPNLGGSLRLWASNPEDMNARSNALRTLHTLKGSSRLAGAMRLGELSHRMESEIEELGTENLSPQLIDPLLGRLDVMQAIFEVIAKPLDKAPDEIPYFQSTEKIDEISSEDRNSTVAVSSANGVHANKSLKSSQISSLVTQSGVKPPVSSVLKSDKRESRQSVRVRARLLDGLVNQAGEVMLTRTRIESELGQLRGSLGDLTGNLDKLRQQLRDVEFQAETQMQSRMEQAKDIQKSFDPLEFDRFTRVQELTRMMAESVNDVATVQRNLQRAVDSTEDDLIAQARQTRDLQRDLLRTRMEEFESISDRLYRVVRQASKEAEKQVKLDIIGGSIELDRGVLERMTPSFEHLLRNCIAHGLEHSDVRMAAGKDATGAIAISLMQDGNDVVVEFSDDGTGLNYKRIREQAVTQKLISKTDELSDAETINLIFSLGLSTASQVTELSGRGIGLDVVRSEVVALGGRIDVSSVANKGTKFKLVLPLTTAVTQVVMMRTGALSFGVPSHLVEVVRRSLLADVEKAYLDGFWGKQEENIPFYWSGALLQASQRSTEPLTKTNPVVIFRSAGQRVAIHVDEIFGNKEVVIKNLGPQLARLPGLAGMAILVSGAVALIYNPVALASVYGSTVQQYSPTNTKQDTQNSDGVAEVAPNASEQQTPLILVVDDSITVRRVTQRMLQREGFRVVLAVDGLQAIEKLNQEIPAVVLSDIEMPRMDGFDLVRNIRSDSKLKHLPVVMITSRIAEKHRDLAMELGVNDYLGKPYSEEGLLAVLRHHTARKLVEPNKVLA